MIATASISNARPDAWPRASTQTSFGRHESFHIRDGWLIKGMEAVAEHPDVFGRTEAIDILGVGRNMVSAIRHWLVAAGLIEEISPRYRPDRKRQAFRLTPLAELLRDRDPYFEEDASLWIAHAHLATNYSRATTWFWAFNCFGQGEFQRDVFLLQFARFLAQEGVDAPRKSLERDFSCFVRTYAPSSRSDKIPAEDSLDCPLAALGLVDRLAGNSFFRFVVGPKPNLPDPVVAYGIYRFAENARAGSDLLPFDAIRWGEGSPGRLFGLDNESLFATLERLEAEGGRHAVRLTRTAGLVQVHLGNTTADNILRGFYGA